jgi:Skp family chaperone for outer membrane proteins
MKTALIAVPIALAAGFFSSAVQGQGARAQASIGYVSAQRIFAEATDAKTQISAWQAQQQQRGAELRPRQQALEAIRQQLARTTDAAERTELQKKEQQQKADLDQATAQAQSDLQAVQRQIQNDIQMRVRGILADLSKGENFQIVLNSDTTLVWAVPGMDLTDAVITRLNEKPAAAGR